jgi:hypothetical protein
MPAGWPGLLVRVAKRQEAKLDVVYRYRVPLVAFGKPDR